MATRFTSMWNQAPEASQSAVSAPEDEGQEVDFTLEDDGAEGEDADADADTDMGQVGRSPSPKRLALCATLRCSALSGPRRILCNARHAFDTRSSHSWPCA